MSAKASREVLSFMPTKSPAPKGTLTARIFKYQCFRALIAEPNRLKSRLFLANVTMPEFPLLSRYDFIWGERGTFTHTHEPPMKPQMLIARYIKGDTDTNERLIAGMDHGPSSPWCQKNHPEGTSKNIRLRRDDRRLRSPWCRFPV